MPFIYQRTIRFQDTDAAGVVYFANVLSICHEAYEASLAAADINLKEFFGGGAIAVPIVHAQVDFWQPMFCGESYRVQVVPTLLTDSKFEISYAVSSSANADKPTSQALTRHVCIDTKTRTRVTFPANLKAWLDRTMIE
ncbi:MAG: thioesterase family protein [Elainellaceae cyanobacterium]